jgi:hypothetical protein
VPTTTTLVVHRYADDKGCREEKGETHRYIQFDVSRFGLPVNHSGAKVIQPGGAVNHVSASRFPRSANAHNNTSAEVTSADPHTRLTKSDCAANNARAPPALSQGKTRRGDSPP